MIIVLRGGITVRRVRLCQFLLDSDTGERRAGGGLENRQHAVSGGVHDAALVCADMFSEDRSSGFERLDRCAFVVGHQPRVTGDIRRQYRR